MEKNSLVETRAIMPAMQIDEAVEAFSLYQQLRDRLKNDGDFILFDTSQGKKETPTKQWRVKLERFFGLSVEIAERWETQERNDGSITYHKKARVTHPRTGLYHEATGACNVNEKIRTLGQITYQIKKYHKDWSDNFIQDRAKDILRDEVAKAPHNTETHAETRAKNRAVLEFVGFGEVSAEEMGNLHREDQGKTKSSTPSKQEKKSPTPPKTTPKFIPPKPKVDQQIITLHTLKDKLTKEGHWGGDEDYHIWLKDEFGVDSSKVLSSEQKTEAIKILSGWMNDIIRGKK